MTRGELAVILAVVIAALGVGWWVHPGAGLVTFALGLGGLGIVVLRFPEEPEAPESVEPES